jgi:hypothetical protein
MITCALRVHVKKINEDFFITTYAFNLLSTIKYFVLLNVKFLLVDTLTCALRAHYFLKKLKKL